MNKRLDPGNNIREGATWVDMGNKAATYIFDRKAEYFSVGLGDAKGPTHQLLKDISSTSDDKWAPDFDDSDGGNKNRLELQNDDGTAADDFIALVRAAYAGEEGLTLSLDGRVKGRE